MKASFFATALLPLVALASPIANLVERDAASITSSITNIQSKIATLNTTLNGFSKSSPVGLLTALKIQSQNDDLGKAVQAATKTVNASQPLSDADSLTVGLAFLNLEPQIFSLLDNIVAHKPAFDTVILGLGGVGPLVKSDLQNQKSYAAQLGAAVQTKLSAAYAALAPGIIADISAAFDKAIAAFANDGFVNIPRSS